ncbi:MAG: ATP-binding protein [Deltaproteobacteria bacterium]|nr:ATP-binding protein [Deltaproteobacteria bacterium]
MDRFIQNDLVEWSKNPNRKPLVIRGARQVGKSFIVRWLGKTHFSDFIELNLEESPEIEDLFQHNNPKKTLQLLEAYFGRRLTPEKTLIFLDEIQAAPKLFAKLRFFYESLPNLAVIAAGSLLDLLLAEHEFSMPVGRIEYKHLGPVSFEEYLLARSESGLIEFLRQYVISKNTIPEPIHKKLLNLVREFQIIGGMPEAVMRYIQTQSFLEADQIKQSILSTYKDDFNKYRKRIDIQVLNKVFLAIPRMIGKKFKYTEIDSYEHSRQLSKSLQLLCQARVGIKARRTFGNGLPLGAEADNRNFKVLFLDVGLVSSATGLRIFELPDNPKHLIVNRGPVCEQFIGQHLLYLQPSYVDPELYYWERIEKSASAEVDYVIVQGPQVVPVEVKAGKTGTLKSLHFFMASKKFPIAVRFNADQPSVCRVNASSLSIPAHSYELVSLPLYLVQQLPRILQIQISHL